jgi:Immunoglobulin domain
MNTSRWPGSSWCPEPQTNVGLVRGIVSFKDEPRAFCRDVLDPETPHMFKTSVLLLVVMASTACVDLNTGNTNVRGFPVITTQPKVDTVTLGAPATFSVAATGDSLTYQWYKGSSLITGATSTTFTIASTVASDAGVYQVIVTNPVASIGSDSVSLVVMIPQSIVGFHQVGGTASSTNQGYTSATPDESAVYVSGGGDLTLINARITKAGNATSVSASSQTGANAGVRVDGGSKLTFVDGSVSTDSAGATALFATGTGSIIEAFHNALITTGASSDGVAARLGATIHLENTSIRAGSGILIRATGSSSVTFLANADSLVGDLLADASSTVTATLQNGATLTGVVQGAAVSMDSTSKWNVTGASALTTLSDPAGISGLSITNIVGNGFTVTYLANLPANAVLGGKTYSLTGGGSLVPK